ncbi:MAG: TRAP transporter large permease subunit, partial [Beijerinckiaceae bacterium]
MTSVFAGLFGILFGLLAVGAWIGISLAATAMILAFIFTDMPLTRLLPQYAFNILTSSDLVALPLFV